MTDAIREAHEHLKKGIAEMKAAGQLVPLSLHKAAQALNHATEDGAAQQADTRARRDTNATQQEG